MTFIPKLPPRHHTIPQQLPLTKLQHQIKRLDLTLTTITTKIEAYTTPKRVSIHLYKITQLCSFYLLFSSSISIPFSQRKHAITLEICQKARSMSNTTVNRLNNDNPQTPEKCNSLLTTMPSTTFFSTPIPPSNTAESSQSRKLNATPPQPRLLSLRPFRSPSPPVGIIITKIRLSPIHRTTQHRIRGSRNRRRRREISLIRR